MNLDSNLKKKKKKKSGFAIIKCREGGDVEYKQLQELGVALSWTFSMHVTTLGASSAR